MSASQDLSHFIDAQDGGGAYERALTELRAGRKVSHWMWFVFPQIAGLGHSTMARQYAIASLEQARAYLDHPVLGSRLLEGAGVLARLEGHSAADVLGATDAMKLRSSMTLFAIAAPEEPLFDEILRKYFDGLRDPNTESRV